MVAANSPPQPPITVDMSPIDVVQGAGFGSVMQAFFYAAAPPDAHAVLERGLEVVLSAYPTFCG